VEDGLAVQSGEARGAVGHYTGALGGADGRAQVRLGRGAEDAAGAWWQGQPQPTRREVSQAALLV